MCAGARNSIGTVRLLATALTLLSLTCFAARADTTAPAAPTKITAVSNYDDPNAKSVGLNGYLAVALDGSAPLDPANYVLFLNGRAMTGLTDSTYDYTRHALVFHLQRNDGNAAAWAGLLGSARGIDLPLTVALGNTPQPGGSAMPTILGDGAAGHFKLAISSVGQLVVAAFAILAMLAIVLGGARYSTLLKDNLLPQLEKSRQPYSLGRWQMAFWFTLVFASFVVLYVTLWDYNTISNAALVLMGLSGVTAIFAVAVDAAKQTPVDDVNTALRALGLNSYDDVLRVKQEIADRQKSLGTNPPPANAAQLQSEIVDRELLLATYEQKVKPFVSGGWYNDLTTDINGPALHRVQVFCWTWLLGAVFVIGVWRDLAMPDFNATLLALMGISSAGYIGFKYPEQQN